MPTVSHAIPCYHHEETPQNRTTLKRRHNFGDIFANNEVNIKNIGHGAVFHKEVNVKDIGHGEVFNKENDIELVMIKRVCKEILLNNNINKNKNNDEYGDKTDVSIKIEHNILLLNDKDETTKNYRHNNPISTNNNTSVGKDKKLSKIDIKRHGNEEINNFRKKNKENLIKKPRWKLNTGMLVILVILNVTSQGIAVEGLYVWIYLFKINY